MILCFYLWNARNGWQVGNQILFRQPRNGFDQKQAWARRLEALENFRAGMLVFLNYIRLILFKNVEEIKASPNFIEVSCNAFSWHWSILQSMVCMNSIISLHWHAIFSLHRAVNPLSGKVVVSWATGTATGKNQTPFRYSLNIFPRLNARHLVISKMVLCFIVILPPTLYSPRCMAICRVPRNRRVAHETYTLGSMQNGRCGSFFLLKSFRLGNKTNQGQDGCKSLNQLYSRAAIHLSIVKLIYFYLWNFHKRTYGKNMNISEIKIY